jgi:hypothetical protein
MMGNRGEFISSQIGGALAAQRNSKPWRGERATYSALWPFHPRPLSSCERKFSY